MKCGFSKHISMESWPKLITHDIEMVFLRNPHFLFVPPSKIFVWEGKVEMRISKEALFKVKAR
jgi:hypothetical protein